MVKKKKVNCSVTSVDFFWLFSILKICFIINSRQIGSWPGLRFLAGSGFNEYGSEKLVRSSVVEPNTLRMRILDLCYQFWIFFKQYTKLCEKIHYFNEWCFSFRIRSAINCKKSDPDPVTSLTFVRRCRLKKAYSEFIRVLVNCHVVVELGLGVGGSRVQTVGRPKQLNMKRDNNSLLRQQLQVSNRDTPLFHRLDEDAHFWHLRLRANSDFGSYSYFKRCYFLLKSNFR